MVESTALEMRRTGNRIGGSNPSLSAILVFPRQPTPRFLQQVRASNRDPPVRPRHASRERCVRDRCGRSDDPGSERIRFLCSDVVNAAYRIASASSTIAFRGSTPPSSVDCTL